ncbi:MAG: S8 family peptidase [Proteobacteria bacterium]|nr:S8 family peptidase [Pseudomonadota bacterium]
MIKSIFTSTLGLLIATSAFANEIPATYTTNDAITNIHNRCIVRFSDDMDSTHVTGLARAIAAQAGASLQHIYKHSIKGFAINMPCAAANAAFGYDSYVVSMEPDGIASINKGKPNKDPEVQLEQFSSYGTGRVGGSVDGSENTAWIIDTGIDLDHPDLNVDASRGFTVISSKGLPSMNDENGHGTHVAGTIGAIDNDIGSLGVAANTTVVPVRVLDRRGSGSWSGVIAGIDYVAEHATAGDCVNMSLGGAKNEAVDAAVIGASEKKTGVFFVLAAGNDGDDANNHSPARVNGSNIWTISAVDINDRMPSWSNYGTSVDYAAPGVNIFSLWKDGGTKTISGTSMAAPHACAVLMMTGGHSFSDGKTAGNDPDDNPDSIIHL